MDFTNHGLFKTSSTPLFEMEAQTLMHQLQSFSVQDLMQREHWSVKMAMVAFDTYQRFFSLDQFQMPAIFAYHGTAFEQLDAATLSADQLAFANNHLLIFSALYGILRPLDRIRPYRLDMKSALIPTLYSFWRDQIDHYVMQILNQMQCPLMNLASQEYFQLLDRKKLQAHHFVITPLFKQEIKGKLVTNSLYAKQARGLMSRFIIEHQMTDVESVKSFMCQGYAYVPELSTPREWVFVR